MTSSIKMKARIKIQNAFYPEFPNRFIWMTVGLTKDDQGACVSVDVFEENYYLDLVDLEFLDKKKGEEFKKAFYIYEENYNKERLIESIIE